MVSDGPMTRPPTRTMSPVNHSKKTAHATSTASVTGACHAASTAQMSAATASPATTRGAAFGVASSDQNAARGFANGPRTGDNGERSGLLTSYETLALGSLLRA